MKHQEQSQPIEATGDSIIIAEALRDIADSLRAIAQALQGDDEAPHPTQGKYLDGKKEEPLF